MLRITINKSPSGVVDYFTKSLAVDDYFFTGKTTHGYFHGKLVDELSLPQIVTKKAFSNLVHNQHPVHGESLTPNNKINKIASIEYLVSAPKSVSILMALSTPEISKEILNAHRFATKKMMIEIEKSLHVKVGDRENRRLQKTDGIVTASFTHFTSRPMVENDVENIKYSSDPQLHTHVIVPNIGMHDGRYLALDGGGVHRSAQYFESIYHSHLSKRLVDKGFTIQKTIDRWEVVSPGMTKKTLNKFSRRSQEINEMAKTLGLENNAKKKADLGATTRLNKTKEDNNLDLKALWQSKLTEIERRAIENPKQSTETDKYPLTPEIAIERSLSHHLERKSTIQVRKVLSYALNQGYGVFTPQLIKDALAKRDGVIYGQSFYSKLLTTKEMVRKEEELLEWVAQSKGRFKAINADYQIKQEFLNEQQRAAVKTILSSQDQVSIFNGSSGTGKSTTLTEIRLGIEQGGKTVIALAPSATASRDVLYSKGFTNATTIASFLINQDLQQKAKDQVLLIDEFSMIGTNTMLKIKRIAQKNNTRIILSGDVRQLSSPEAGDICRHIINKVKPTMASIDIIQRQKSNPRYKYAIEAFAKGEVRKGYERLDKMGTIKEIGDYEERYQYIAKEYSKSLDKKKSVLIISPTNIESKKINEFVRAELKTHERIQKEDTQVTIQKDLSFTKVQKQDLSNYEEGMRIQFFQNMKGGIKAGMKYEVCERSKGDEVKICNIKTGEITTLPKESEDRFQVFRTEQINVAGGDNILILQNGKTKKGSRIYNGQTYTIKNISPSKEILLTNGKILDQDFANFNYAYCSTVHKTQGKDCDDVILSISSISLPAINDKSFYVGASRAKSSIKVVTDDKEILKNAILKSGDRMGASELKDKSIARAKTRSARRQRYYQLQIQKMYKNDRARQASKSKHKEEFEPKSGN